MKERNKLLDYMRISAFLAEHPDYYDKYEQEAIKGFAQRGTDHAVYTTDVVREIADHLGIIPDDYNIYIAFQKLLEEKKGIEGKDIIEVGGGILPTLAHRIHLSQKTGSITVYDPRLGNEYKENDRFILKREPFRDDTRVTGANLIIGLMPCKGAEALISAATKNNIDFMVWLCEGGPHGDYFDYFESDDEWIGSTIYLAERGVEKSNMGKVMVKKMEEFSEYPIIYNQR